MEELKRFQGSTFDEFSRRRLIEDRDNILELTSKIQELQNEINCMKDSRDFQDAESVRSGQSHVTSQPVFFPPHPDPGGMLSRSLGMPSRKNGPPSIWDTHGISGNVSHLMKGVERYHMSKLLMKTEHFVARTFFSVSRTFTITRTCVWLKA